MRDIILRIQRPDGTGGRARHLHLDLIRSEVGRLPLSLNLPGEDERGRELLTRTSRQTLPLLAGPPFFDVRQEVDSCNKGISQLFKTAEKKTVPRQFHMKVLQGCSSSRMCKMSGDLLKMQIR